MSEPSTDVTRWADKAMFEAAPIRGDGPTVKLLSATPDPLGAIAAMCRMYEGKPTYDLADVTDDERKHYWEQVKATHLKAPLEAVDLHFFIEGVDRAFTHQIVRQRTAVFAQESMRFAVKENLADEVGLPPTIREGSMEADIWRDAVAQIERSYKYLIENGVPAEDARGLLPTAVPTRLHYKTNLRNLLDHAGNRLCTQAQFVWRWVFSEIVKSIRNYQERTLSGYTTWQFEMIADDGLFKPVCYSLGHCPFTADFDRACSIRDRVQAGEFEKINDAEWLLDPAAARER